jgi:hypothetical protein
LSNPLLVLLIAVGLWLWALGSGLSAKA